MNAEDLANGIVLKVAWGEAEEFVRELNGSFCLMAASADEFFACVDRVRSLPLFFSVCGRAFAVADDARALAEQVGSPSINDASVVDLLRCGYCIGQSTLYAGVSQLQAGQLLHAVGATEPSVSFYYQHTHSSIERNVPAMYDELDQVSERVFDRLIRQLDGRLAVLPLSGGYDSRYIAAMLKRLDYDHVLCYTYGAQGSYEIAPARETAARLGYPWHFVQYDASVWDWFVSAPDAMRYLKHGGLGAAIPHVQDFPALHALRQRGVLPTDAVIVPGFCGDLLGGSFVPGELAVGGTDGGSSLLSEGLVDYVHRTHMYLHNPVSTEAEQALRERIANDLEMYPHVESIDDFVSVNEAWFTANKASKWVVNSLRVYEHFGLEWYMPLWDNELVEFWYTVPLRERIGSCRYNEYLFRSLFRPMGIDYQKDESPIDKMGARPIVSALLAWVANRVRPLWHRLAATRPRIGDPDAFSALAETLIRACHSEGLDLRRWASMNEALAVYYLADVLDDCNSLDVVRRILVGER